MSDEPSWDDVLDEYEQLLDRRSSEFAGVLDGQSVAVTAAHLVAPPGPMPPDCVARARSLRRRTEELVAKVAAAADDTAPRRFHHRPARTSSATTFDRTA